jgi:hydroxymethylbilane synthase
VVQLLNLRPDLRIEPLRGNLDTRLRKLDEGGYDAIVLAAAGLIRLGLAHRIRTHFSAEAMLPAAGQGALGIEARESDGALRTTLARLTHPQTWLAAHAERAVSRALGGSCSVPLAAFAQWQGDTLELRAALGHAASYAAPLLRAQVNGRPADAEAASSLGEQVAQRLREQGAEQYLAAR